MPGPLHDCYVLANARSAELALRFLDHFLPERSPSFAAEDPGEVLGIPLTASLQEILQFLERNPARGYTMYWQHPRDEAPYHAMLAFNEDGSLILGLSPSADHDEAAASLALSEMLRFSGAALGYVGVEEAPAESRAAFLERAARHRQR